MTDTAAHTPVPATCCCPNNAEPKDGYIVINAGCRIHGLQTNVAARGNSTLISKDMQLPASSLRNGGGTWHRMAE